MPHPIQHTSDLAIEQAWRLLQAHRVNDARTLLQRVLATDPDHAPAHALLALCFTRQNQLEPAEHHAKLALHHDPTDPLHHVVLGDIRLAQRDASAADELALAALSIDPSDRNAHALRVQAALARHDWPAAIDHAQAGLADHPQDSTLLNLHVTALTHDGRKDEAAAASASALSQNPESAWGHANQGWAQLHANHPKQAITHFHESLRLDAGNDWARAGLVEALKARNPVYRVLLGFFLWMQRLPPNARVGVLVGGFVGYLVLGQLASHTPALRPFVWPLMGVYLLFAVMTWVASPLFNLLLRLSPAGRHALTADQKRASTLFGLALPLPFLLAGTLIAASLLTPDGTLSARYAALAGRFGVSLLLLLLPFAAALQTLGTPRQRFGLGVFAGLSAAWLLAFTLGLLNHGYAANAFQVYTWAFIAALWTGSFGSTRPGVR